MPPTPLASVLRTAANALRSERVNSLIAEEMQAGGCYPRALQSAVVKVYGADAAAAVSSPNNILAVEYIRALEGSGIAPLPIKRKGVSHDRGTPSGNYASASQIRAMLRKRSKFTLHDAPPFFGTTQLTDLIDGRRIAFATACTSAAVTASIPATCSAGSMTRPNASIVCP